MASASASASASTSTAVNSCYQIFLNHRGPDTKHTFTSHLYHRLVLHGFRVFWDKEQMQVGDTLSFQIHEAIKAASLHVAIFSPRYAESKWCLDELVLMVESEKPIIPVFYGVQPTALRHTEGDGDGVFARALCQLKNKRSPQPRYNSNTIQKWREVLSTVAEISGLELDKFGGDEGELLEKVIDSVLKKLGKTSFDVAEYPTGLDEKIEDFEKKVLSVQRQQSGKPQVIGIVGLGGIGKTTLVKELFNRKSSQYQKSCFLFDVRENAHKASLESLQKKLLKGLTQIDQNIESVSEGIELLKTRLSSCDALVILDDVDHISQLDALLRPIRNVLHPHSLILITSRDKGVLTTSKVEESSIYKLTGLNTQHSQELFCLHAFSQGHPLPGFEDLVHRYLKASDGLPLSLKVFGALLYENDNSFWQDQLDRLEEILPEDIQKSLQISYDALQRDEKQIFLDIACFFIGKKRDTAIRIWDGSGWKGSLGFRSLQNKNLVEVDIGNNIRMHDHLRDLGRDLAKNPELPRRIWRTEHFEDLLQQSSETDVRGISIRWKKREDPPFSRCKMRNLQLLDINVHWSNKYLGKHPLESIRNAVQSPSLIWFRWHNYFDSSPPSWIQLKKLRVLEVNGNNLEKLWQKDSQAPSTILEQVEISGFKLKSLPDSLWNLTGLKYLYLRNCFHLEHLWLSTCKSIEVLPAQLAHQWSLEVLHLQDLYNLTELPSDIGELKKLKYLNLEHCFRLKSLPDSLGQLNQLTKLTIRDCCSLHQLSFKMVEGERESIRHLDIHRSNDALTTLKLSECSSPVSKLQVLNLQAVEPSLETLVSLEELDISHCRRLRSIRGLAHLPKLRTINVRHCDDLEELVGIEGLTSLEWIDFDYCFKLRLSERVKYLRR